MFKDTHLFRQPALTFLRTGVYTNEPQGSPAWYTFWSVELDRCINGYEVNGVKITGDHYFYLNYCQIKKTSEDDKQGKETSKRKAGVKKKVEFPDFWDGDYNFFWAKEIARKGMSKEDYLKLNLQVKISDEGLKGGKHMIIAKARRKGFSYKNAAICVNTYNTERNSTTLIGAFDKKYLYPKGTMSMAADYLDFIDTHTGWAKKRDLVNKQDHKRASFKYTTPDGSILEKGYKSEIIAITFKDNPDAGRGKDASLIVLEEAGTFANLKSTYFALKPAVESGMYTTGQIIIFGTGGDMEAGTIDFEDMFYDPDTYGLIAFENIWDETQAKKNCGFFFPDSQNKDGFIDKDGNSKTQAAVEYEQALRQEITRTAKDKKAIDMHIVEHALCPAESFLRIKGNIFPGAELQRQLSRLEGENDQKHYWIGNLVLTENYPFVEWKPDINLRPILDFPSKKGQDATGCVIIYEPPYEVEGQVPDNMYIGATDPYDQDKSGTGSLGSTLIYNRLTKRVVAEYSARPETAKEYYEVVRRLLIYYNAQCLYENERKGMFDYFESKTCLYLLADEPQIIHDVIKDSHVNRKKGIHMTKELKEYGEQLIKMWLLEPVDEDRPEFLNLHKLRSQPLLKELISYNDEGNFDRAMAFMMLQYYIQELRKQSAEPVKEVKSFTDKDFFKLPQYVTKKQIWGYQNIH